MTKFIMQYEQAKRKQISMQYSEKIRITHFAAHSSWQQIDDAIN